MQNFSRQTSTSQSSNSSPTRSETETSELQPFSIIESEQDSFLETLLALDVGNRGTRNCTRLMEAASEGNVDTVDMLILHKTDINALSVVDGNTALMYGCERGHEEIVRVLLKAGANVEIQNKFYGHTALMKAVSGGHVQTAKILLEHGADINTYTNESKESALTLACKEGHLEMVRLLLKAGADKEHKTKKMYTALMETLKDGHMEVARLLLDSGARVNKPTNGFESPLTLAADAGHVNLVMLLIKHGANIEETNDQGYMPLMQAARRGYKKIVSLFLTQDVNINAQTVKTGETALTLACYGDFLGVADFLIKAGADIELGTLTPLMEASRNGCIEIVRYLLESAADINVQKQTGRTALIYAIESGYRDVVDLLQQQQQITEQQTQNLQLKHNTQKSLLSKNLSVTMTLDMSLTSTEAQQVRSQSAGEPTTITKDNILDKGSRGSTSFSEPNSSLIPPLTASTQGLSVTTVEQELQIEGTRSSIVNQSQQQDSSDSSEISSLDLPNLSSPLLTSHDIDEVFSERTQ